MYVKRRNNLHEFLRQDSQSSYSFGKIQNVGDPELSEEKI